MKRIALKIKFILIIIILLNTYQAYAQENQTTIYEKKKSELLNQIWPKFGRVAASYVESWSELTYKEVLETAEAADIAAALIGFYSDEMEAAKWYAQELTKIQYLRTPVDNQREKKLQAEHDKQKALEEYEKTDIGKIYKGIRDQFNDWNSKGEFEKEADYLTRVNNKSKSAFTEICISEIVKVIKQYDIINDFKKELSEYDTKNETLPISFTFNDTIWTSQINVPIEEAPSFKKDLHTSIYEVRMMEFKINKFDWALMGNSIYPTKINLIDEQETYELLVPIEDLSDIVIYFDSLNIENSQLKGEVFKFSDARALNEQRYVAYCKELDSLFNDFNDKLLRNPYNIDRYILSDYKKMSNTDDLQKEFNSCLRLLKNNYNNLDESFERELIRDNKPEYCKIYYSLHPGMQEKADKEYFECRCRYSDRTKFDLAYINNSVIYNCGCRENAYLEFKELFVSKAEFNKYYDMGNDSLFKETTIRMFDKNAKDIASLDFKGAASNEEKNNNGKELLNTLTGVDLTKDNSKTDLANDYVESIAIYKKETYYEDIINYFIKTNKGLYKEWEKNKLLFSNKTEFYEAYISRNYKQILKDKKKTNG